MTIAAPQLEDLPVAKLTVDHTVQRAVDKPRVDKIVKDYQRSALGTIVVSRRDDGTHHVIDGQHRVQATIAVGLGDETVPCLVYSGLSRAEEASMFRRLNNTRVVQAVDKFRVRVVEGDPVAVTLNNLLSRHGWYVQMNKDDGAFAAVTALESVYRGKVNGFDSSEALCDTLLRVLTEAWDHNADGVRAEIVRGTGAVLARYGARVDLAKLTSSMGTYPGGPRGLVGAAKGLHGFRGGTLPDALAEVLVEMLNKGRRSSTRLPEWRSHV